MGELPGERLKIKFMTMKIFLLAGDLIHILLGMKHLLPNLTCQPKQTAIFVFIRIV